MQQEEGMNEPSNSTFAARERLRTASVDHRDGDELDEEQAPLVPSTVDADAIKKSGGVIDVIRFLFLLLLNVMAWYMTNGFNGIAMQSYASRIRQHNDDSPPHLLFAITIMTIVTCMQLALGACIGCVGLWILNRKRPSRTYLDLLLPHGKRDAGALVTGSLHALGSVSTNLGFAFGSASLVQIIKLLEPFETLLFSQLLVPADGKCRPGVLSSMSVVVGAALSLIRIRPNKPHPYSITFAILSGLTLSLRNVLQRRQHITTGAQQGGSSSSSTSPRTTQSSTPTGGPSSQLERSVLQFTTLSLQSAHLTGLLGMILAFSLPLPLLWEYLLLLNYRVLIWHPLYNIFSMITLGFCTALTHSLLNAGKRVSAIVMAILWFREGLGADTALGLALVAVGGIWYTVEIKRKTVAGNNAKAWAVEELYKVPLAILILYAFLGAQSNAAWEKLTL